MACMKLNKAIVFGCAGGSVGLAGLYLVNKSELSSFVMGGDGVTLNSIVLVSGAKAIPVDCYKNGAKSSGRFAYTGRCSRNGTDGYYHGLR